MKCSEVETKTHEIGVLQEVKEENASEGYRQRAQVLYL